MKSLLIILSILLIAGSILLLFVVDKEPIERVKDFVIMFFGVIIFYAEISE